MGKDEDRERPTRAVQWKCRKVISHVVEILFSGVSRRALLSALAALPALSISARAQTAASGDTLPSWNDGATKQAILNFVSAVTREGLPDFVPSAERIATFDNDGTLWVEHPMYTQLAFVLDRVKATRQCIPNGRTHSRLRRRLKGT